MNSGHVYVVRTVLSKPVKDKIVLCICSRDSLFFWINTQSRPHGIGQLALAAEDHPAALTHPCYLDCSRATTFPPNELAAARHRGSISPGFAAKIVGYLRAHPPKTLTPKHRDLAIENLRRGRS